VPIETNGYVAECFWPDVREDDLRALDERVHRCLAEDVRYLGSMLLRADEVVLCLFEGPEPRVREIAEQAQIPFERLLETGRSPWIPAPVRPQKR